MRRELNILFLICIGLYIASIAYTVSLGNERFVAQCLLLLKDPAHNGQIKSLFTPQKYQFFIGLNIAFLVGLIIVFYHKIWLWVKLKYFFQRFYHSIIALWDRSKRDPQLLVILVPLSISIYLALMMPISYDEAWTYLNFTQKGFLPSVTYYPAPNNHVLYSLATNVTAYLPFDDLLCMRLPTLVAHLLLLLLAYDIMKRWSSKQVAVVTVTLMSFFYMSFYYSYMARGYALSFLFFIIGTYSCFMLATRQGDKYYWALFGLSSVFGFWTIPTFLYPFVSLNVYIMYISGKISKTHLVTVLLTALLTLMIYTPIIVVNGLGALTSNVYVKPLEISEALTKIPSFLMNAMGEIVGISPLVVCILLIVLMFLTYKVEAKTLFFKFFTVFLIMPMVLLILHRVIPFPRTFYYYTFVFAALFVLPFQIGLYKMKPVLLFGLIFCIQAMGVFVFSKKIKKEEAYAFEVRKTIDTVLQKKYIYCNSGLYDAYALYYAKQQDKKIELNYVNPQPVDLDTVIGASNYDYLVVDRALDKTTKNKPIYENPFFSIYK